jgi:perosamine synthetase
MIPIAKPYVTNDEAKAAHDTVLTGWISQGPKVAEFEKLFSEYTGSKYAVAVSNCTTGLHLSMIVSGVSEGDEVICPSMSYVATANCIKYVGAIPVFAEVNEKYNLDINDVINKITSKTKAILLVHQIGMPADIESFRKLCDQKKLCLIEDSACAIGSSYKNQKIGSNSELSCFSFHPRKVISTGEGGMITTNNESYYNKLKLLRQHGMSINDLVRHKSKKVVFEDHVILGYNYRMTDIQASIGIKQLEKLDWIVEERRKIAHSYNESFKDINCIRIPIEEDGYFSNYQSYSVYLKENCKISRNELMSKLLALGIATRKGIMTSHRETAYKLDYSKISLPNTEKFCDNSILLPLYVPMSSDDLKFVISNFLKFIGD